MTIGMTDFSLSSVTSHGVSRYAPSPAAPNRALRSMVRETRLTPEAFVYPLFVCPGEGVRKEVRSMPGVFNLSVDEAVKEAREVRRWACRR